MKPLDETKKQQLRDYKSPFKSPEIESPVRSSEVVRWIPVTKQKPKPDVKVLAWSAEMESHGHAISFGKRVVGRVIDECRFENSSGFYFTHWLPLPYPPNGKVSDRD